jgi:hypothetical protein
MEFARRHELVSRLSTAHSLLSLDLHGIEPWISFGLFIHLEAGASHP